MKKSTLLIFLTIFTSTLIWAQSGNIKGTVKSSEDGLPLPGVTVAVKGTTTGTITGPEGTYELKDVPLQSTITYSFVGLETQEMVYLGQTVIDIMLEPSALGLDEIVVIGYGVKKKSLVTGAIAKVNAEDLEKNQIRIENALQGKTSGVNVVQESGSPGGGVSIRIRGTGTDKEASPLFIVDGMPTGGIEYLNPNEIESVEILKDGASAAIYGSDGANGVVLITTKSGKVNTSIVSYSATFGVQEAKNLTEVLDAKQYANYYRDGLEHEIRMQYFGQEIPDALMQMTLDASYPFNSDTLGTGTNWMKEIFSPATMQEHNIMISGGSEKSTALISAGYLSQNGIVGGSRSNFERYTARTKLTHEPKSWLDVGANVSFTHFQRKSIGENNEFGGVISNAMNIDPLTPVFFDSEEDIPQAYYNQINANFDNIYNSSLYSKSKGFYGMSTLVQNEIANPVAQIANTHNDWFTDKVLAGTYANIKPIEGLTIRSSFNIDLAYGNNRYWNPAYYYHSVNYNYLSSMYQSTTRWFNWQLDNVATYQKTYGDHDFTGMIGQSMENKTTSYLGGLGEGMLEESWNFAVLDAMLSDSTKNATGGYISEERKFSYFGRVSYDYKERYLLEATLRYDASSKLSQETRFDLFPSVSLGWIATKEDFWNFDPINFLKVRLSYGQNGNSRSLETFMYTSIVGTSPQSSYYLSGGNTLVGAEPTRLSNPELIWETSVQYNFGVDMRMLNDRFNLTVDLYRKNTVDLITKAPVPEYVGNISPYANAGEIRNQGIEVEIGYKNNIGDIEYDVSANVSFNRNKVIDMQTPLQGANLGTTGAITIAEQGYPLWYFYGYEATGIFDSFDEINAYVNDDGELIQPSAIPGDVIFKDINGDGVINEDDKTKIGNPHPDWVYGFNANMNYKGFDLRVFFQGTIGNDVYFGAYRTDLQNNNKPLFLYENAWTPDNHTDDLPRYTINDNNNNYSHNSLFVFDGSYLRLQTLELGYTFSSKILERVHFKKVRLYVSGQNLFTITKYPGADPEVGNSGNAPGIDRGLYPRPRILSFGLNITI